MQSASSYLLAAVVCASFALSGTAQAQPSIKVTSPDGSARLPSAAYTPSARIPDPNNGGKTFDGPGSHDYGGQALSTLNPPNPDIAVGPDDILMVVGQNEIVWVPNPNNPDTLQTQFNTFNFASSRQKNWDALKAAGPWSEIPLDTWLGTTVLDELCGTQRDSRKCLIGNPTVRYDQMHGRFAVLLTVINTGVLPASNQVTQTRGAHWVLLVSTHAKLLPGDVPGSPTVFTPPLAPEDLGDQGTSTGGQGDNWLIYYVNSGNLLDINDYSTHPGAAQLAAGTGGATDPFPVTDCTTAGVGTDSICLFPTSASLGIDNDSLILVSPVINVNEVPDGSTAIPGTTGPTYGNRVRIVSKAVVYTGNELETGNTLDPPAFVAPQLQLSVNAPPDIPSPSEWDMFRATSVDLVGGPVYTIGLENAVTDGDGGPVTNVIMFEPSHLRGRALAKYSNFPLGGYTELIGDNPWEPAPVIYTQQIAYRADYVPSLVGDEAIPIEVSNPVWPPQPVPQMLGCTTTDNGAECRLPADPWYLYTGDARFQRAIYREGHVYAARAGQDAPFGSAIVTIGDNEPRSTVFYDVVQTIYAGDVPGVFPGAPGDEPIATIDPLEIISAKWQNGHFYAPMFDVTANVIRSGPISPSYTLPFLEKLFVGTTSPRMGAPNADDQGNVWPSLYDIRQGLDRYDNEVAVRNPETGDYAFQNVFGQRGGASTDPIRGGLWAFGAFADYRREQNGPGQWGTHAAYYPMSFPTQDVYGTNVNYFSDVDNTSPFFTEIQTAAQLGLTNYLSPAPEVSDPMHGQNGAAPALNPNAVVLRKEMAAFIVYSQMDEAAVDHFLENTPGGIDGISFSDVAGQVTEAQRKAIEVMYRRGYTVGYASDDAVQRFGPNDPTTRGAMAIFVIRAKMNNVFPTVVSGCNTTVPPDECTTNGDNFGLFLEDPYFTDVQPTDPYYIYIQKLRELSITRGYANGAFGRNDAITRGQMITFIVRAFHY